MQVKEDVHSNHGYADGRLSKNNTFPTHSDVRCQNYFQPWSTCTKFSQSTLSQENKRVPFLSKSFVFNTAGQDSPPICLLNPCYKTEHMPLLCPCGNYAWDHSSLRIFLLWKGVMFSFSFFFFFNSFLLGILVSINWLIFPKPHFLCWFRYNPPWLLMIFLIPN